MSAQLLTPVAIGACRGQATATQQPRLPLEIPAAAWRPEAESPPTSRPELEAGAEHYSRHCATCHAEDGSGSTDVALALDPPPTSFLDADYMWDQTPAWYQRSLIHGIAGSSMQPWDHVLDAEGLWDVVFYTWTLSVGATDLAVGRSAYLALCAECHGADGRGVESRRFDDPTRVAQSRADELAAWVTAHPELAEGLADDIRQDLVEYTWTFIYVPKP